MLISYFKKSEKLILDPNQKLITSRRSPLAHAYHVCSTSLGYRGYIVGEKCSGAPCRVEIHRVKPDLRCVNGSGKVIVDQHLALDQHQKLTTSRGSALDHAYHVWSTSVTAIVCYPANRQNNRQNARITLIH